MPSYVPVTVDFFYEYKYKGDTRQAHYDTQGNQTSRTRKRYYKKGTDRGSREASAAP